MRYFHSDTRGTQIEVGQRVAYNISGDIALGEVAAVKPSHYEVLLLHKAAGLPAGHISKVRRATSMLVLRDGDVL